MNIYVGNLNWSLTGDDLYNMFTPYGEVVSAKIITDKFNNNRSKGFGFVEMSDDEAARQAISNLHDTELSGRKIIVNESAPRKEGDGGGYDILSFDQKGSERFLEVKTTVGSQTAPFYLTRNELSFCKERPQEFRICRLYDFAKIPKMFELAPPLDKFVHLEPLSFEASFK